MTICDFFSPRNKNRKHEANYYVIYYLKLMYNSVKLIYTKVNPFSEVIDKFQEM